MELWVLLLGPRASAPNFFGAGWASDIYQNIYESLLQIRSPLSFLSQDSLTFLHVSIGKFLNMEEVRVLRWGLQSKCMKNRLSVKLLTIDSLVDTAHSIWLKLPLCLSSCPQVIFLIILLLGGFLFVLFCFSFFPFIVCCILNVKRGWDSPRQSSLSLNLLKCFACGNKSWRPVRGSVSAEGFGQFCQRAARHPLQPHHTQTGQSRSSGFFLLPHFYT